MSGNSVRWLRTRIGEITGQPLTGDTDLYDNELENRVRDFQRAKSLQVDGIAGTQTQILINNELAMPSTPRLAGQGG
jgi:general secretion pathway protein A